MSETKTCKECLAEIPAGAARCQHCGQEQTTGVEMIGRMVIATVLGLSLVVAAVIVYSAAVTR